MEFKRNVTDLDVFKYLKYIKNQGVQLVVSDGKIKYQVKKANFDKKLIEDIRKYKNTIVSYFASLKDNEVELSSLQLAYMTGQAKGKILNKVNAHYYIEFEKENLNVDELQRALNILIKENDVLRLILLPTGKGIILNSLPKYIISTYVYESEEMRNSIRGKMHHKRYYLETWPMFSFIVGKNPKGKDILHVSFDCSILDAWSAGIMLYQLFDIYSGNTVQFTDISYKQYMKKVKDYKNTEFNRKLLISAEKYWNDKIQSIPKYPKLKTNQIIENLKETNFIRKEYTFSKNMTNKLIHFARMKKVTFSAVLITIYMKVLSYFSENKDITINATLFGKLPVNKGIENLLGEFTNIGLLSYEEKEKPFIESVKETQNQIFKLLEYRLYDGVNIINKIAQKYDNRVGFPAVVTCMIGEEYSCCENGFYEVYSLSQTPQVFLDHHIRMVDETLVITFDYVEELFYEKYIDNMLNKYTEIVRNIQLT